MISSVNSFSIKTLSHFSTCFKQLETNKYQRSDFAIFSILKIEISKSVKFMRWEKRKYKSARLKFNNVFLTVCLIKRYYRD